MNGTKKNLSMHRKTVVGVVQRLMDRVRKINSSDLYCYRVKELILYGSFVNSDKPRCGDVDVGFLVERRFPYDSDQDKALVKQSLERAPDYKFARWSIHLTWPEEEVLGILKGRTAAISLHSIGLEAEREVVVKDRHIFLVRDFQEQEVSLEAELSPPPRSPSPRLEIQQEVFDGKNFDL